MTAQEVWFAVAMPDGVSLAVRMGGVSREKELLQQASNHRQQGNGPVSAGGINAALLGLSSAADVDLGGLRNLWLTIGSMDRLRDPGGKAAPSLMQGDKVLFSLDHGIKEFYQGARKYAPDLQATKSPETTSANTGLVEEAPKV